MYSAKDDNSSGKVFVQGQAVRSYTCDEVEFTITFRCRNTTASKAVAHITAQCEQFLQHMKDAGMDISSIILKDDQVSTTYYSNNDDAIRATRELCFTSSVAAATNNLILCFIRDNHLDADLSTKYSLSNEPALRRQLRAEAVIDSRENAELLAMANGYKVIGIDSIDIGERTQWKSMARSVCVESCGERTFLVSKSLCPYQGTEGSRECGLVDGRGYRR